MPAYKDITLQEKAAVCWAVFEGIREWVKVFRLAHGLPEGEEVASRRVKEWKRSARITNYIATVRARSGIYEGADVEKVNIVPDDGRVDFTDRDQFIDYLNRQINTLGDDGTKTKYLQMLSDLLRYKESRPEGENEIQRFYTPITCSECNLYKDAHTRLIEESKEEKKKEKAVKKKEEPKK